MKKILSLTIIFTIVASVSIAQTQEEINYYQAIFGMGKKQVVAQYLKIDNNHPFWVMYDEYEEIRQELGQQRLKVIMDYAKEYQTLTDEKIDELILNGSKIRKDTDELIDKYYKKMKKVYGVKMAAQFSQIERYFINAVNMELYQSLPLIGELDN